MLTKDNIELIIKELSKKNELFVSERHLQIEFCLMLKKLFPKSSLYPEWTHLSYDDQNKTYHFDLLVELDKEDTLFEFKYKTTNISLVGNYLYDLRDQKDTTNGRYDVWEDIKRIEEFVKQKDTVIKNGYVIFITSNMTYLKPSKGIDKNFSVENGFHHKGLKEWLPHNKGSVSKSNRKSLLIQNDYEFEYKDYSCIDHRFNQTGVGKIHVPFKYLIVEVNK